MKIFMTMIMIWTGIMMIMVMLDWQRNESGVSLTVYSLHQWSWQWWSYFDDVDGLTQLEADPYFCASRVGTAALRSQGHPLGPNLIIIKHWRKFFLYLCYPQTPGWRARGLAGISTWLFSRQPGLGDGDLKNTETCDLQEKGQTGICVFFLISKVTLRTSELRF